MGKESMKITSKIKKFKSKLKEININKILKSKWVIFGVIPFSILVGPGLLIWMGHLLTTYPAICLSCHAKQTSISMWASSAIHPESVTCVNCHAKVNQMFPRDFFADERVNKNCLFCHSNVAEKGMETIHQINFDHKLHSEEPKLKCTDCHKNIEHEKMQSGKNRPYKSTCIECHPEAIGEVSDSCLKCHAETPVRSWS